MLIEIKLGLLKLKLKLKLKLSFFTPPIHGGHAWYVCVINRNYDTNFTRCRHLQRGNYSG